MSKDNCTFIRQTELRHLYAGGCILARLHPANHRRDATVGCVNGSIFEELENFIRDALMGDPDQFVAPVAPIVKDAPMPPPAIQLAYEAPQWAARLPDLAMPRYFVECLKNGVSLGREELQFEIDGAFVTIGRVPVCNLQLDHASVSRFHCILQLKSDGTLWLYDNNSSHGTWVNKRQATAGEYVRLYDGDQLRFGASTRIFVLEGGDQRPEEAPVLQKSAPKPHTQQPQQSGNFYQMLQEKKKALHEVTWGMMDDEEDDDDQNDGTAAREDFEASETATYRRDPQKSLRHWLLTNDYDPPEFDYTTEMQGDGEDDRGRSGGGGRSIVCKIRLPFGNDVFGVGEGRSKREASDKAALDACIQIDARGLFKSAADLEADRKQRRRDRKRRQQQDSGDEDDEYLDRTASHKKPTTTDSRKHQEDKPRTENLESLLKQERALQAEIETLADGLTERTQSESADDDLDAYMASIDQKLQEEKRQKVEAALEGKRTELKRVQELIQFLRPAWLDDTPKAKPPAAPVKAVQPVVNSRTTANVEKTGGAKKFQAPPIPVSAKPLPQPSSAEVAAQKPARVIGPSRPDTVQPVPSSMHKSHGQENDDDNDDAGVLLEDDWVPPVNQRGDGTTDLNKRLGY